MKRIKLGLKEDFPVRTIPILELSQYDPCISVVRGAKLVDASKFSPGSKYLVPATWHRLDQTIHIRTGTYR